MINLKFSISIFALLMLVGSVCGQAYPERRHIRGGNRAYEKGQFSEAEVAYRRSLEKKQTYEGIFNLSDALYKQGRYEDAVQLFTTLPTDTTSAAKIARSAAAFYNYGNALFQQRKLQESAEAYKQSLRMNPTDQQAKFNLAYVLKMLENQDKNKDQQKDQKQDQPQNQPQKQPNQQKQSQPDPDQKSDPSQSDQQQPREGQMSKEEADQLLKAMEGNEANTRKKVVDEKKKGVGVGRSGKNW